MRVYTDSDWAGDKATRRSMSGGCIFHGDHVVALSSAEAELYAGTRAATECIRRAESDKISGRRASSSHEHGFVSCAGIQPA
eukprot:14180318-Heterocapsa_arctica.AAC.2